MPRTELRSETATQFTKYRLHDHDACSRKLTKYCGQVLSLPRQACDAAALNTQTNSASARRPVQLIQCGTIQLLSTHQL
jgi:hypothetical protein